MSAQTPVEATNPHNGGKLVVATRIHLGKASSAPSQEFLDATIASFLKLATTCGASRAAVAVDPAPKIDGYDLPSAIRLARDRATKAWNNGSGGDGALCPNVPAVEVDVLPVTPWGHFVPALNALMGWAARSGASLCLLVSAETAISPVSIDMLCSHVDSETTLVAGAALPGHDYQGDTEEIEEGDKKEPKQVELNGRTSPWNTLAVWNIRKIALTGFALVSDGLHPNEDGSPGPSGVEEASSIAVLQRILPEGSAIAKLVKVPGIRWEQEWDDEERKQWHEQKMKSKLTRAARHLELLGLSGWVTHC